MNDLTSLEINTADIELPASQPIHIPTPVSAPFIFTLWDSDQSNLNKEFYLDDDCNIKKSSSAHMSSGSFRVVEVATPEDLNKQFNNLNHNQAVSIGLPFDKMTNTPLLKGKVSSKNNHKPGTINRTKEHMQFSNCFLIDIDDSDLTIDQILPTLCSIDPNLMQAAILIRPSSSYGIRKEGDQSSPKQGSYHIWVGGVCDPTDIDRYGKAFSERCWLHGLGKIVVSKSGSFLERQLVDASVFSPERLVFEAKPILGEGITQDESKHILSPGFGVFNTTLLRDLTPEERTRKQALVTKAKRDKQPDADKLKKVYITNCVKKAVQQGSRPEVAQRHINASLVTHELYSSQSVKFDDHGIVTVADILQNPAKFDECTLADPLNWHYDDQCNVAKFYANDGIPCINSFKHGGYTLSLKAEPEKPQTPEMIGKLITNAIEQGDLTIANHLMWIVDTIIMFDLDSWAEDELLTTVISSLNLGKQKTVLKSRVKGLKIKRAKDEHATFDRTDLPIESDLSKALEKSYFPDVEFIGDNHRLLPTENNLKVLLNIYGITSCYDINSKEQTLSFLNGDGFCADMQNTARLDRISSLCALNLLPASTRELLSTQFASNAVCPVVDYISNITWDGKDHISTLLNLIEVKPDSQALWNVAGVRWLIQCVAAADHAKRTTNKYALPKFEGCLILVGPQGISKTAFYNNLIPSKLKKYFSDGLSLNTDDKDSVKQAVSNWIVELGEIESTMTMHRNGKLKAFLSKRKDEMRLPYDRTASHFERRTSFCGSANDPHFLSDDTGSRRFWPIDVTFIPEQFPDDFDIDQLWAQVWHLYISGEQWWDDAPMRTLINSAGKRHSTVKAMRELLTSSFDLHAFHKEGEFITVAQIRDMFSLPANDIIFKDIHTVLKEFEKAKITVHGYEGYNLKLRKEIND